jgi:hypothetical protein
MKKNIILCLFFTLTIISSCKEEKKFETIKDISNLQSIYNSAKDKSPYDYDLEETIRIIHGLDKARTEVKNFKEYIEFLSTQDYSNVAADVIEAKGKLLPILNSLRIAEIEYGEATDLWNVFMNISEVVVENNMGITTVGNVSMISTSEIVNISKQSFEVVKKQKEVVKEVRKKINTIKDEYIEYLEEFVPIYLKYMTLWDKICLVRDNAYLSIHQGNIDAALISLDQVLELNENDREAIILKSFCLLLKQQIEDLDNDEQNKTEIVQISYISERNNLEIDSLMVLSHQKDYADYAKDLLDQYIDKYPNRSAPALLLLGTYYTIKGEMDRAVAYYNQSSIEYPSQSLLLLDMLNSYKQRAYLRKTAEGLYILKLYKSTMEGFGFFSPNFQKALIAKNNGDINEAKEEIIRHFFRRGNQEVYDFLITDVNFCETYLDESFNLIFREKSFIDLIVKKSSSKKINIKLNNRSDKELKNVRIYLCVQFTDMYKDDYEVFKLGTTVNTIKSYEINSFDNFEINYELYGKTKNKVKDIVSVRTIIVTDEIIAWVDQEDFKIKSIINSFDHYSFKSDTIDKLKEFFVSSKISDSEITKIKTTLDVITKPYSLPTSELFIKLPRVFALLNPYFSINPLDMNEVVRPTEVKLNGQNIEVKFKTNIPRNNQLEFYLNSDELVIKWLITFDENKSAKKIETSIL